MYCLLFFAGASVWSSNGFAQTNTASPESSHRIYTHPMDPREHPDYDRYYTQPPHAEIFGNRIRFTSLRNFTLQDNKLVNYREEIEKYVVTHDLGDILWPMYDFLYAENLAELLDYIQQKKYFVFDVWAYVPGSGPGGIWQQFQPPPGALEMLDKKLGPHWLGMDNGEQDGRYIGRYAAHLVPQGDSRQQQYFNFQRHFEKLTDELGNRMAALVSLTYGHYFAKEGLYTLIGAETAQALPNSQIYYAFLRGAGKQYGVPWFGNASVFNRWGFKAYTPMGEAEGYQHGPTKGTSLSLLKRLMYNHIFYNCTLAGFEGSHLQGDQLSPIGKIQQSAKRWTEEYGSTGTMLTPVAVMTDFFAGWTVPRHLYTKNIYRVWGNLPYEEGDFFTDHVLDMFYPGYQDSSFYHDESGFLSPTPYGDTVDCLLSDAPGWLLERYALLVLAGELRGGLELRDKLDRYLQNGGHLVTTAGSLKHLPGGLAGVLINGNPAAVPAGANLSLEDQTITEHSPFQLYNLSLPEKAAILARSGEQPAAVRVAAGRGMLTVLAAPFGVSSNRTDLNLADGTDVPLSKPCPLLEHVRLVLDSVFRQHMLFDAGRHLSLIAGRKAPGDYLLCICNNSLWPQPLNIASNIGPIESMQEIPVDQSEKTAVGYLPEGFENASIGTSAADQIAGGDVRVFSVRVGEKQVQEIPHAVPPPRPKNRILSLRKAFSIKEEILSRPTFFQHFDGVMIDWKYLRQKETAALQKEAGWLLRNKVKIIVDLSSGINLYPDLRLVNNIESEYQASMAAIADVMNKMKLLGAADLILSIHRSIENNFSSTQFQTALQDTFEKLLQQAESLDLTLYCRPLPIAGKADNLSPAVDFIRKMGSPRLRLAANTALVWHKKNTPENLAEQLRGSVGLWLVAAPQYDLIGRLWNLHGLLAESEFKDPILALLGEAPDCPMIFDGNFENQDQEYMDNSVINTAMNKNTN